MKRYAHLIEYLENVQKHGRLLFLKKDALQALNISENALQLQITRLAKKRKVAYLKKGMYQIIPVEYERAGSLPPEWIIDDLMTYLQIPYYVGLLSAASFHGAAHQAPQIFQVICQRKVPDLRIEGNKICFYASKDFSLIPTQDMKTPAGYVKVSTPEGTAFDLLRYLHQAGHLNHVTTLLAELAEVIDAQKLAHVAQDISVRFCQRLGYLLDMLGHESLTQPLHQFLSKKKLDYVLLRADQAKQNAQKNIKWHIIINEHIEPDI